MALARELQSGETPVSAPPPRFLFPVWANRAPRYVALSLLLVAIGIVAALWYWGTDKFWRVGYQPQQPVEFSHKLHAGDLGLDCRYCHATVERSAFAAVPPTQTCMNCHRAVRTDSAKLALVRARAEDDFPIPWVRVHDLPDYVYFDHRAHVGAGVGCASCHGRVDQMQRVAQTQPLTMGWCLDCHRDPRAHLRGASSPTQMDWQPTASAATTRAPSGREVHPPLHCSGCHR